MNNHFHVYNKRQLASAIRAGAYPTFEEARSNPFTVHLAGTNFKLTFAEGLHEQTADRVVRRIGRLNAKIFQPQ